jgi:hypothetical protein
VPLFAVTEPVIDALVAVSTPALVTLNGAVEAVDDPAKNGYESGEIPTAVAPDPAVSDVAPMVNPPIWPADAEIVPLMFASVAVTAPVLVTRNGAVEAVDPPSQRRYAASLEESLATPSPDPTVMSPVLAIVVFPPLRDVEVRDHPPIAPDVAVTDPVIDALVAVIIPEVLSVNDAEEGLDDPPQIPWKVGDVEFG